MCTDAAGATSNINDEYLYNDEIIPVEKPVVNTLTDSEQEQFDHKLIYAVKCNPILYNRTDFKNSKKLCKRIKAWKSISKLLKRDVKTCKSRWSSFRTFLARIKGIHEDKIYSGKLPKGMALCSDWKYFKDIKFLLPHLRLYGKRWFYASKCNRDYSDEEKEEYDTKCQPLKHSSNMELDKEFETKQTNKVYETIEIDDDEAERIIVESPDRKMCAVEAIDNIVEGEGNALEMIKIENVRCESKDFITIDIPKIEHEDNNYSDKANANEKVRHEASNDVSGNMDDQCDDKSNADTIKIEDVRSELYQESIKLDSDGIDRNETSSVDRAVETICKQDVQKHILQSKTHGRFNENDENMCSNSNRDGIDVDDDIQYSEECDMADYDESSATNDPRQSNDNDWLDTQLINLIKEHPIIYDNDGRVMSNRCKKHKVWKEVALRMGANVEDCKIRWDRLKKRFMVALKYPFRGNQISRLTNRKMTLTAMKFYLPYINKKYADELYDMRMKEVVCMIEKKSFVRKTYECSNENGNSSEKDVVDCDDDDDDDDDEDKETWCDVEAENVVLEDYINIMMKQSKIKLNRAKPSVDVEDDLSCYYTSFFT